MYSQPVGHTRDRYFLFQPAKVTSLSKRHFCRDENEKLFPIRYLDDLSDSISIISVIFWELRLQY